MRFSIITDQPKRDVRGRRPVEGLRLGDILRPTPSAIASANLPGGLDLALETCARPGHRHRPRRRQLSRFRGRLQGHIDILARQQATIEFEPHFVLMVGCFRPGSTEVGTRVALPNCGWPLAEAFSEASCSSTRCALNRVDAGVWCRRMRRPPPDDNFDVDAALLLSARRPDVPIAITTVSRRALQSRQADLCSIMSAGLTCRCHGKNERPSRQARSGSGRSDRRRQRALLLRQPPPENLLPAIEQVARNASFIRLAGCVIA